MMDKKAIVARFVDEFNRGNLDIIKELIAAEFFAYAPTEGEDSATDVFYALASNVKNACPDLTLALDDLVEDGDLLRGQMTLTGTRTGTLWGSSPNNQHVTWREAVSLRFIGEQFAVSWDGMDIPAKLRPMRALGVVPPPEDMDKPLVDPVSVPEALTKVIFTGQVQEKSCSHVGQIKFTDPATDVCQDCVALGDEWPALRMCLICGYIGCCDTSVNMHMKKHYEATGHSIFRSIRLEEGWIWCYEDNAFLSKRTLEQFR